MTVLFSAHQMSLVERLADRLFVMQHGREVLHGTIPEIREQWGSGRRLLLEVRDSTDAALDALRTHGAASRVERRDDGLIEIALNPKHDVGALLAHCSQLLTIIDVRTEQPSLHDVYINTVGANTQASMATTEAA
jgi:ABC-2 type transport system ATP-binding protein